MSNNLLTGPQIINGIWVTKNRPRNIVVSDNSYYLPEESLVRDVIYPNYRSWLTTMKLGKWYHKWDCDNFSEAFKVYANGYYFNNIESRAESIAVGIIHYMAGERAESGVRGAHATNVFFTFKEDKIQLQVIEPQNGKILSLSEEEFNSIGLIYI